MNKKIICFTMVMIFIFSVSLAEAKVFDYNDVLAVFKKAMGNRYGTLNSNNKTGIQGVYDYIVTDKQISTTTVWMDFASSTKANISDHRKLAFFKGEFLKNSNSSLSSREKDGIKQGMVARFTDLCQIEYSVAYSAIEKNYKTLLANLEKTKNASMAVCQTTFNNAMKNPQTFAGLDKMRKMLKTEELRIAKDICVNAAYTLFYNQSKAMRDSKYVEFTTAADMATTTLNSCKVSPNITSWNWLR